MTFLLESPWPWIGFGIFAEVVLGLCMLHTQRGVLLWPMGGVLALVLGGLAAESAVVTERERVEAALDGCAAALEANDLDRLLTFIAASAGETRSEARRAVELAEFIQIKVKSPEITINELTSPPTAKALFTAVVTARDRHGQFGERSTAIDFQLDLRREGDRWLIARHELKGAPAGFSR